MMGLQTLDWLESHVCQKHWPANCNHLGLAVLLSVYLQVMVSCYKVVRSQTGCMKAEEKWIRLIMIQMKDR